MLVLAHLGNSFGISPFVFYLVNSLLKPRNKAYTNTLCLIQKNECIENMKIKNIETGNILWIEYLDWHSNYIKKGIYKKFEIVDYSGVVELQTLQKDGVMKKQPFDRSLAINNQRQFSNKMFIEKNLSFDTYDKWLVMKNQSPFFRLFKKFRYQKPNIKFDTHSKRHMTVVVLMILTLLGMFYIAYKQGAFN